MVVSPEAEHDAVTVAGGVARVAALPGWYRKAFVVFPIGQPSIEMAGIVATQAKEMARAACWRSARDVGYPLGIHEIRAWRVHDLDEWAAAQPENMAYALAPHAVPGGVEAVTARLAR
jgi:hypothetical protein